MSVRLAAAAVAAGLGIACTDLTTFAQSRDAANSRKSMVARAQVWRSTDVPSMNLRTGPAGADAFAPGTTVTCRYVDKDLTGFSPKFACRLADGIEIKVKYVGADNISGEVFGEVAASRLLWALGFAADRMYPVRVVCQGCPKDVGTIQRDNGDRLVDPAAIERKLGRELADRWDWDELNNIQSAAGGATRAQRDALKLLAVFLQHGDNKAINQRIVCLDEARDDKQECAEPLMMIQDLGITFGRASSRNRQPRSSVNLREWAALPVWKDAANCIGNLPGAWTGTLKDPVISEEGRQFLADLLVQLSDTQLHDMFDVARVNLRPRAPESGRSDFPTVDEWVAAFKQKRAQIVEHHCAS